MAECTDDLVLAQRRLLVAWALPALERFLPIFADERPDDSRLSEALAVAHQFAAGHRGIKAMRGAAAACRDAALEAQEPKARAVAEYAGQVMAIAHTASHSRELARYTRRILAGDELADELTKQHRELPEELHAYVFGDWTPQEGPRWP